MLKISRLTFSGLLGIAAFAAGPMATADERAPVLIRNISILDLASGTWQPHRDLVVRGTRIAAIEPTGGEVPAAKVVINGEGKFAIPGLFDNRVDLGQMSRETAGLFVAHGITSVDAGTESDRVVEWRREIAHGKFMGPRIVESTAGSRAGNAIGPSSNAGAAAIPPGLALHQELARLVTHGMTPAEALRRATIGSASHHGRSRDLGSIAVGKIADMLILNGDPLLDITRTRAIDAVVFRGEALTRAHLNLLLSKPASAGVRR